MKSLTLHAPAKLNIFLKVVNKRLDGYHNLVTLFERIDLCDQLTFRMNKKKTVSVFCDHPDVPLKGKNLIVKTAKLLKDEFALECGIDIYIKKNIPVAAGLAGGSSNAATTLIGLNKLWKLNLNRSELVHFAKKIGSDVPFFIFNYSWALGTQRGDRIEKVPIRSKLWHVLVIPRLKVYSREVFARFKMQLTKKKPNVNMLTRALGKKDLSKVSFLLINDLESIIVQLHPNLLRLKDRLYQLGALGACFSGSGPSLFGLAESERHAEQIKSQLARTYKHVYVVRTL